MDRTLTWLHLTDLHFGEGPVQFLWPKLKNDLLKDIKRLAEKTGAFDVVFFTGDFVRTGATSEFEKLSTELLALWETLKSLGNCPVLCPIPGNHDLFRPSQSNAVLWSLRHWWNDDQIRKRFWSESTCVYRTEIEGVFSNYTNWIANCPVPLAPLKPGILPGDFSATIEIESFRLGVIGLNTTFLQLFADDYVGKLDVHVSQLLTVCDNDADKWVGTHDLAILLTHHPDSWFDDRAREHFLGEIYPAGRFHAHFCGHQHVPLQYDLSQGGAIPRRLRQGPSLFGLENVKGENNLERLHGYNPGRFEITGDDGIERVWPRSAIKTLSASFRLCPDQRYELTEDDCFICTFDIDRAEVPDGGDSKEQLEVPEQPQAIVSENIDGQELELLGNTQDEATALENLITCDRFLVAPLQHHRSIRLDEQSQFENGLRQKHQVWVVADWGTGVDGFLAASFDRFRQETGEVTVFHLRCDEAADSDAFESLFSQQFGLPLQRFCSLLVPVNGPFLLLDKVHPALNWGDAHVRFRRIVSAMLDYCPNLRIVVTSRTNPHETDVPLVELKALEPPDVRTYLLHHNEAPAGLCDADVIEKLHERSGGLPMHLDRMLRALKVSSLELVLEAELERTSAGTSTEDVPKALVQAVASLNLSTNRSDKRSFRLLQVLTVLPYGEIIDSLRHFLPKEPFFIENAIQLHDQALLDVIPLYVASPEVGIKRSLLSEYSSPKILKVPRQVRDYVQSCLAEEELREIVAAGADHFFGRRWREGKVRPRSIPIGYQEYLNSGPGNEFTIIHYLLQDAKSRGENASLRRAAKLAVDYCRRLQQADRYRDLEIVAGGILLVLEANVVPEAWTEIGAFYGEALRMTAKRQQAIDYLRGVLQHSGDNTSDPLKASMFLDIAYAEKSLRNLEAAASAAEEVKRFSDETSVKYFSAQAIIEGCIADQDEAIRRLKKLREEARSRKFTTVADNISLDLVRKNIGDDEKIELLDSVLKNPNAGAYNKTRALSVKARIAAKDESSRGLIQSDRNLLAAAYIYSRSQRLGDMFNNCHQAMWQTLEDTRDVPGLLRLFRQSSFLWRIRGEDENEAKYAERLSNLKPPEEAAAPEKVLILEVRYFWRRFRAILKLP